MNQIDLKGRVAVVTGGAQGIGYATSERLLRSGASVVMWDIDAAKLEEAQASLSKIGTVHGHVVELTSDEAVAAATAQTIQTCGHIDILVNNAGITGGNAPTWELDPQVWRRVIEVNLIAPFLTCRAIAPHMTTRGWGRIVTSASSGVVAPIPNLGISNAMRMSLVGWSKTLAREVAREGITCNVVVPGRIATPRITFLDEQKAKREGRRVGDVAAESTASIPLGRYGDPQEYADTVAFLASKRASYITGSIVRVDGGMIASI